MSKKERPRWAYAYGTYFEWSESKEDYIRQITLPKWFFAKKYGISPYDEPMGCYRIIYLEDLIGKYRRNKKKIPAEYCYKRSYPDDDSALITRIIMEELKHEQIKFKNIGENTQPHNKNN